MNSENLPFKVLPLKTFNQEIILPTSKSHCNRALILGAVCGKNFKICNVSKSTDVQNLISAFKKIGLKIRQNGSDLIFENSFPECEKESNGDVIELHTGDGGTTNRFLIALLSLGKKEYHLYPSEKMSERPIDDLINPLRMLNVDIKSGTNPWITLKGPASLYQTTKLEIDCSKSTQFASALMLAFSQRPLQFEFINLKASETYLKMTSLVIKKGILHNSYTVPVDFSSLSYPAALAALMGRVLIKNCHEIDVYQADSVLVEMLEKAGAQRLFGHEGLEIKKGTLLKPIIFDINQAPDLFPTLVFLASHIEGESVFSNLEVLRLKESDRLDEMMKLMQSFGVEFEYSASLDQLKIKGQTDASYARAVIHPARDHRIVMAAALFMAKNSGGELYEADCVEKSYPDFFLSLDLSLH